ncbi:DDE-type integrase/transposase/recombinase [Nostoc sp. CHAB 5824]|nr:DDE-type integrase/transposase/recombinase [Nostoc sp. CHAB 5824]
MYRTLNSLGNTLHFLLTAKQYAQAVKQFFRKTLTTTTYTQALHMINANNNSAYLKATDTLKTDETLSKDTKLRQYKY